MADLAVPRIQAVVDHDLCIACGACVEACPARCVRPVYHPGRGAHEVEIVDPEACVGCAAPCDEVCPSVEVDLPALLAGRSEAPQEAAASGRRGPLKEVVLGYAPAHRDGGVSSSGGVLRAFVEKALAAGIPVLCLARSGEGYGPRLLQSVDDLTQVPGSIYHSVSFVECLSLLRGSPVPCVLVSTPCQLEGVEKYIHRVEPELEAKVALRVGLICGWMYSDHAVAAFARYKGLPGPVTDVQYRGEDKVGKLKIVAGGETSAYSRRRFGGLKAAVDYNAAFSRNLNRLRCRLCENHLNLLADVIVGDAWLERRPQDKLSIVAARTVRGVAALRELEEEGAVRLEPSSFDDLLESQSPNLVYGEVAQRLNLYRRQKGLPVPRFRFGPEGESEGDTPGAVSLSAAAARRFRWERVLRSVVRRGLYRSYRFLYLLRWRFFRQAPARLWNALFAAGPARNGAASDDGAL